MSSSTDDTARYVYCIAPAGRARMPASLRGIAATDRFDIIRHGSVEAITSPVAERDFDQQAMEQRLGDPRRLEADVHAHQAVIRAVMAAGPAVPLRFATVLRTRDDVRRVLEIHREPILQTLDWLRGKKEWGVKLAQRDNCALEAEIAASARSGRDYLTTKQQHRRNRSELNRAACESARECHRILAEIAELATELPTENRGGDMGRLLLNGAYLVADEEESKFHSTAAALGDRLAGAGMVCEETGPWPAYNFVNLDLSLPGTG